MTSAMYFEDNSGKPYTGDPALEDSEEPEKDKYPPPILKDVSEEKQNEFLNWLDEYLEAMISDQLTKQKQWAEEEEAYRAKSGPKVDKPFIGCSNVTVPAVAMAVDPIHARLDTGIFKQDPVFKLKMLKKSFIKYGDALNQWVDFYQKNRLKLRRVASPRMLEATKLGTCAFKTVYDRQAAQICTYDENWNVVKKTEVRFSGPRVFGVGIGNLLFPPLYQDLQDCPIVAERIPTTFWKLKVAEASGKLTNVDKVKNQETVIRTQLEQARADATQHDTVRRYIDEIEIFEVWCDYDINGDDLPEHLVATYHKDTRTLLQLRYNWYFHQRKPYTVIPYSLTNDSLYGFGLCEMIRPLQDMLTSWERMASDNAYLANIRMFIVKKDSGIEEIPRLYAGRCFFVDDPQKDFIPFAANDIYPSTLTERQNIFGLIEKRTGVSDYLTGRESPIIGSRATATSTLALIQEGTKRVEQVLENFRHGFAEIIENCMYIWIQYGLDGLDDLVFGDDEIGSLVAEFFATVSAENVNGAIAIDLSATDAAGNRQAMQTMQLQIIQIMMQYLEKVLEAGAGAMQAMQTQPELALMINDVMKAARKMFKDLLTKYDVRDPDSYLPDLEKYLNVGQPGGNGAGNAPGAQGGVPGNGGQPAFSPIPSTFRGPPSPSPAVPGAGGSAAPAFPVPGLG
jgi:hypothetical protein